jgi:hypothetical protein
VLFKVPWTSSRFSAASEWALRILRLSEQRNGRFNRRYRPSAGGLNAFKVFFHYAGAQWHGVRLTGPPAQRGFGTMLIERTLTHELYAVVNREFCHPACAAPSTYP